MRRDEHLKTALLVVESVGLRCPHCEEPIPNPYDHSHLWDPDVYLETWTATCANCGMLVKVPKARTARVGRRRCTV